MIKELTNRRSEMEKLDTPLMIKLSVVRTNYPYR